jgi:hypothetical protein
VINNSKYESLIGLDLANRFNLSLNENYQVFQKISLNNEIIKNEIN